MMVDLAYGLNYSFNFLKKTSQRSDKSVGKQNKIRSLFFRKLGLESR